MNKNIEQLLKRWFPQFHKSTPTLIEAQQTTDETETISETTDANLILINDLFKLQSEMDQQILNESIEPLYFSSENPVLIEEIQKIENSEKFQMGSGIHKAGFRFLSYILLSQRVNNPIPLEDKQAITSFLKTLGINTPDIINTFPYKNDITFEIQKSATGTPIGIGKPSDFIYFFSALKGCKPSDIDCNFELTYKYNFEMLKKRVLTGIPHIEKFLEAFTVLSSNDLLDYHGRNIHYSEKNGYSFIDLCYTHILKNFNNENFIEEFEKNIFQKTPYSLLFSRLNGTMKYDRIFRNYTDFEDLIGKNFAEYIYLGILTNQFLNVMKTTTSPLLPNAKFYAISLFAEADFFGASTKTLNILYNDLKTNNKAGLNATRLFFDLPEDYDFNKELDGESFIKAMDLTYAMEQPTTETDVVSEKE